MGGGGVRRGEGALDLSQDFTATQQGNLAKSLGGQGFSFENECFAVYLPTIATVVRISKRDLPVRYQLVTTVIVVE